MYTLHHIFSVINLNVFMYLLPSLYSIHPFLYEIRESTTYFWYLLLFVYFWDISANEIINLLFTNHDTEQKEKEKY